MNDDDKKVQFQEYHVAPSSFEEKPKLVSWVLNHSGGLIKNEKQANYLLLGFVMIATVFSLVLIFGENSERESIENLEKQFPQGFSVIEK